MITPTRADEREMDIFYYWQKFEQDLKNGQVGYFGSNSAKIAELKERLPRRLWVLKTPKGMKGSVQLVASLLVSEEPSVAVQTDQPHVIYYDVFSPESVIFADSGKPERIREVAGHFQYRWHTAFSASFRVSVCPQEEHQIHLALSEAQSSQPQAAPVAASEPPPFQL
jgi:hypothetical protein